jgi:hypothetical protein
MGKSRLRRFFGYQLCFRRQSERAVPAQQAWFLPAAQWHHWRVAIPTGC